MTRRTPAEQTAANVKLAASAAGATPATLAQATDMPLPEMDARLSGRTPFTISELVRAGGFLHVPADSLLAEVAA